ncbi:hypothetical protein M422DRAFT_65289 [Sphaerobolus stellatus SS14]|nr:hypothetical protein M422DRAFT_65289 [Sphaerobolus stellatus SS14]
MHTRRSFPLPLALVMPHPELSTRSPHTPRAMTPSTPVLSPKQLIVSPRTSRESWGSSSGQPEEDIVCEWTPEHISLLSRTLDALPGHLYTPFNGAVPPSNLLDKIARSVCKAQGVEWPHSVPQTRIKIVEIARGKNKENVHMTIDEAEEDDDNNNKIERNDEEESMKASKPRALYRQSSMDFLPSKGKDLSNVGKLSSRLQRTDRFISTYRPYSRPSGSTSPSLSQPLTNESYAFPPTVSTRARSDAVTPRLGYSTLFQGRPQTLRRTVTMSSTLSDVSMASSSSTSVLGSSKPSKPVLPRRSESFSISGADTSVKKAPSYANVMAVDFPVEEKKNTENEKKDEKRTRARSSSKEKIIINEQEKKPETKKRTRSRSTTASPVSNCPERKKTKKSVSDENEKDVTASLKSPSRSKADSSSSSASKTLPPVLSSSLSPRSSTSTRTSTRTSTHSSTATKPTVSSAAKQQTAVVPRSSTSPRTRIASRNSIAPGSPPTASSTTSTRTSDSTSTRTRSDDSMFGPPLPLPQPPTVLPTSNHTRL